MLTWKPVHCLGTPPPPTHTHTHNGCLFYHLKIALMHRKRLLTSPFSHTAPTKSCTCRLTVLTYLDIIAIPPLMSIEPPAGLLEVKLFGPVHRTALQGLADRLKQLQCLELCNVTRAGTPALEGGDLS